MSAIGSKEHSEHKQGNIIAVYEDKEEFMNIYKWIKVANGDSSPSYKWTYWHKIAVEEIIPKISSHADKSWYCICLWNKKFMSEVSTVFADAAIKEFWCGPGKWVIWWTVADMGITHYDENFWKDEVLLFAWVETTQKPAWLLVFVYRDAF
jgi:hypothetical protein